MGAGKPERTNGPTECGFAKTGRSAAQFSERFLNEARLCTQDLLITGCPTPGGKESRPSR
jgi:hypothetical protein